jgi:hypothetical protein
MLFAHYSSFSLGNSGPIKLVSSNEWMWSYRLSNWARLDQKKYVHLLYHLQAVFDDDDVTITATRLWMWLTQPAMSMIPIVWNYFFFFMCSHFKPFRWVLIKGWSSFSQDQKAKNNSLPFMSGKTTKISKTKFVAKTNKVQGFQLLKPV